MSRDDEREKIAQDATDYSSIPWFYKYCSDDERVIKGIFEDHKIRFTQPAALNDPLEFRPAIRFGPKRNRFVNTDKFRSFVYDEVEFPSEVSWLRSQLEENQLKRHGVLSLTKVADCLDMWSRYANGHKGFLLTLQPDFNKRACMQSQDGYEYGVHPVEYHLEYAIDVDGLLDQEEESHRMYVTNWCSFARALAGSTNMSIGWSGLWLSAQKGCSVASLTRNASTYSASLWSALRRSVLVRA